MNYHSTIENKTESTGWHSLRVLTDTDRVFSLQFNHNPTTKELQQAISNIDGSSLYDGFVNENISIYDNVDLLKSFIVQVKLNPTITLAQYNTWLGTKQWWESAIIRYFVFKIALILAQKYNVSLSNYTETVVLGQVRNWIVATDIKQIGKIFFNNSSQFD